MGTGYNPRIVTENLVFCVDAANIRSYPKTGTTWTDLKGGNNGTLNNMTFADNYSTDNGGVFIFDGASDYIQFPTISSLPDGTSDRTMQFWCKDNITGSYGTLASIFSYGNNGAGGGRLFSCAVGGNGFNNRKMLIWTHSLNHISSFDLERGEWTNFTVTVTPGSTYPLITIYKNSIPSSGSERNINTLNDNYFYVATQDNYSKFNGETGLCLIYNRALTDDEIRQNYLATKERYA